MKTVRMLCIMVGSVLAAFLVPLAARAWLASPRPVEAPVMAAAWGPEATQISQNVYIDSMHPYPALAVRSPTVCAVWSRQVGEGDEDYDPHYRRSDGNGDLGTWGGQFNIHSTSPITTETTRVDVAIDSDHKLHFVWSEYTRTPYSYTLYYSYINGSGTQTITQSYDELATPAIAVSDDNKVHVVWSQGTNSIKYAWKPIGNGAWTSTALASAPMAIQPDIEVGDDGTAHVVWSQGDIDADIFYKNSSDSFTTRFKVSKGLSYDGRKPAIAVRGNNVYVAWCEFENLSNQWVYFRQATKEGTSYNWSSYDPISGDALGAYADVSTYLCPAVTVDISGTIHVAFNGREGGHPEDIYYTFKTQDGSWQPRVNVTNSTDENDTTPDIATGGEYVHLIWAGPPPPPPFDPEGNDYEVWYKRTVMMEESGIYLPVIMKSAS